MNILFVSPWCDTCKEVKKVFVNTAKNQNWKHEVIDITTNMSAAKKYKVIKTPTLITIHNEEETDRRTGEEVSILLNKIS